MMNDGMYTSQRDDWETPQALFDALHAEFGFDVDVCSTDENAKLPAHWTKADDGLSQDWSDKVCWMNPPYGREIGRWMKKAHEASLNGATVVCLVPARTDTAWWHNHAMFGEVRFLRGRLTFVGAENPAPFPSAVVVFRPQSNN